MMRYDTFRAYLLYTKILTDLGIDYEREYDASNTACLLAKTVDINEPIRVIDKLRNLVRNKSSVILGAGPSIEDIDTEILGRYNTIICADGVCKLLDHSLCRSRICVYVGDFDGGIDALLNILSVGGYSFIQFHGDNYLDLSIKLPLIVRSYRENVVFTVQSIPLCNRTITLPGFTDGDRAVAVSRILGLEKYETLGMDFDDVYSSKYSKPWYNEKTLLTNLKRRKLEWGKRILNSFIQGIFI